MFFAFALCSFKHPFYLGVTELKYADKEKTLQVTVKLFTNDLEDALGKTHKKKPDIINGDKKELSLLLSDYILKNLSLSVNNKIQKLVFLGFEHENDAVWMYLEVQSCPKPSQISVKNSLLYDLLKNQTNIIHCEVKGDKKSTKLTFPESSANFVFK